MEAHERARQRAVGLLLVRVVSRGSARGSTVMSDRVPRLESNRPSGRTLGAARPPHRHHPTHRHPVIPTPPPPTGSCGTLQSASPAPLASPASPRAYARALRTSPPVSPLYRRSPRTPAAQRRSSGSSRSQCPFRARVSESESIPTLLKPRASVRAGCSPWPTLCL